MARAQSQQRGNDLGAQRAQGGIDLSRALRLLAAGIDSPLITLGLDEGAAHNLPPRTAHALLRCIQEAVTNTVRHARARHVHIHLQAEGRELVVQVEGDGEGAPKLSAGNGLTDPGLLTELALYGGLHLVFLIRVVRARRFAARQRAQELSLFERLGRPD